MSVFRVNFFNKRFSKQTRHTVVRKHNAAINVISLFSSLICIFQIKQTTKSMDDDLELPWDETYWGSCRSSVASCSRTSDNVRNFRIHVYQWPRARIPFTPLDLVYLFIRTVVANYKKDLETEGMINRMVWKIDFEKIIIWSLKKNELWQCSYKYLSI